MTVPSPLRLGLTGGIGSGKSTVAFDAVVEANILMSGLGFENGGLGLAHAMTRGLVRTPVVDQCLHGFHVAYGLLVQLEVLA